MDTTMIAALTAAATSIVTVAAKWIYDTRKLRGDTATRVVREDRLRDAMAIEGATTLRADMEKHIQTLRTEITNLNQQVETERRRTDDERIRVETRLAGVRTQLEQCEQRSDKLAADNIRIAEANRTQAERLEVLERLARRREDV